jgi:hypothetical protein
MSSPTSMNCMPNWITACARTARLPSFLPGKHGCGHRARGPVARESEGSFASVYFPNLPLPRNGGVLLAIANENVPGMVAGSPPL